MLKKFYMQDVSGRGAREQDNAMQHLCSSGGPSGPGTIHLVTAQISKVMVFILKSVAVLVSFFSLKSFLHM
jgi:hypothetical protein